MQTNKVVPCGNTPRPATAFIELLDEQSGKLRQDLAGLVMGLDQRGLSSGAVTEFLAGMRLALGDFATKAVKRVLESMDETASSVELEGQRLRYRGKARKQWLSMFGTVEVERRVYRGDGPGAPQHVALDEDPVAMAMAMLPQREAEERRSCLRGRPLRP